MPNAEFRIAKKNSYCKDKNEMNKKQKIAQLFSHAAFIHDTEENYQAIETLIREQEIGGLTFFHSRHSAAANFEKRAEVLDVSGTFEKLIGLINRYQKVSQTPPTHQYRWGIWIGHADRKYHPIPLCHYPGSFEKRCGKIGGGSGLPHGLGYEALGHSPQPRPLRRREYESE